MQYVGIIGSFCAFIAFALMVYRLHKKGEDLLAEAGYAPADMPDYTASSTALRFIGRKTAGAYIYKRLCHDGRCPVHLFKHVPFGDEPPITSLVIESNMRFDRTAVVYKVYGSRLLFRAFKNIFIKTGDLGIEGEKHCRARRFQRRKLRALRPFRYGGARFRRQ